MEQGPSKLSDRLAQRRTDLAAMRTIIAAERTLMAWIRTSISLIGFGFSIYKFFQYLRAAEGLARLRPHAPRNLGLTMVAFGTLFLLAAAMQHRSFLQRLGVESRERWSLAFLMALLMSLVGVLVFSSMLFGTGPF